MAIKRKLGRPTDQRIAILRGLVTFFLVNGRLETTEARAKEVQKIAEKLITIAIKDADNFTSVQKKVSSAKKDSAGRKVTEKRESKNGAKYEGVIREEKLDMVAVDSPSRLHARRKIISWIYRVKDNEGNPINLANKLFEEIAPKFKDRKGGYTRIMKLGVRRGDAAEMVVIELVA